MLVPKLSTGVAGQISWWRLKKVLEDAGEITKDEALTEFEATEDFLRFKVERK